MTTRMGARACVIGDHVLVEMPRDVLHGWLEYIGQIWVHERAKALEFVPRYWHTMADPL
jgi:hypothetical protein